MHKKYLYEVERGITTLLSPFACGVAPTGGDLVVAESPHEAYVLWNKYANERTIQKGTYYGTPANVDPSRTAIKNVIFA